MSVNWSMVDSLGSIGNSTPTSEVGVRTTYILPSLDSTLGLYGYDVVTGAWLICLLRQLRYVSYDRMTRKKLKEKKDAN